jgi:hypothetical protein
MFYIYPLVFNVKTDKTINNNCILLLSKLKKKEITKFKTYNKIDKYKQSNYIKDIKEIIKRIFKSNYITINNKYAMNYIQKLTKKQSSINNITLIYRLLLDLKNKKGGVGDVEEINFLLDALNKKHKIDDNITEQKLIKNDKLYSAYKNPTYYDDKTYTKEYYKNQLEIIDKFRKTFFKKIYCFDHVFFKIFDKLNITSFLAIPEVFNFANYNYMYINDIYADFTNLSKTTKHNELLDKTFKKIYYIYDVQIISNTASQTKTLKLNFVNPDINPTIFKTYNLDTENNCYLYILHNFSEFISNYLTCIYSDSRIYSMNYEDYYKYFKNMIPCIEYLLYILSYLYHIILKKSINDKNNIIVLYLKKQETFFVKLLNIKIYNDVSYYFSIYKLLLTINISNLYLLRNYNILINYKNSIITNDITKETYINIKNYIDKIVLKFFNLSPDNIDNIFIFGNSLFLDNVLYNNRDIIESIEYGSNFEDKFFKISLAYIIYTFINMTNPLFTYDHNNINYLYLIRLYTFSAIQQLDRYKNLIFSRFNVTLEYDNIIVNELYPNIINAITYNNNKQHLIDLNKYTL